VQIIDDVAGKTLVSASTAEEGFSIPKATIDAAKELGKVVGQRAIENKIVSIVFDRSGYLYHGRIKALADAVREAGLHC
jgi:large subunit ribosomal protein L18